MALGEQILALEGISKERYGQISELEAAYEDVQEEHSLIVGIQDALRSLLREIVKSEHRGNSKVINEILLGYNNRNTFSKHPKKIAAIDKKLFDEAYFLDRDAPSDALVKIYGPPIDYCVVEFFGEIGNLKHLKICERCGKFYLAKKDNKEQNDLVK